jgi:hypothetical protein
LETGKRKIAAVDINDAMIPDVAGDLGDFSKPSTVELTVKQWLAVGQRFLAEHSRIKVRG